MSIVLGPVDLEPLLLGGCFLGSGGGGTVESARSLLAHFSEGPYYPTTAVRVVSVEEAVDGDTAMVAYLGAPVAIDGATYPVGPVLAAQQVQARLEAGGRRLAYVVAPESGALGFTVACLVAAKLGLAVIDADGAGRAVPSLPQLTFAAAEISPRPTFLVSQTGLNVELDVKPRSGRDGDAAHQQDVSTIVDQMMRGIVGEKDFNQFGGLAMWIMQPSMLARALPIRGTLTRALATGRALLGGQVASAADMVAFVGREFDLQATVLARGTLQSSKVDTSGGFDLGSVTIAGPASTLTVLYQNESLLAWDGARPAPLVMAPDTLSYFLEDDPQSVYSNGDLVQADGSLLPSLVGRTVSLVGIVADPALRRPNGLILDSFMALAASMGYRGSYLPLQAAGNGAQGVAR